MPVGLIGVSPVEIEMFSRLEACWPPPKAGETPVLQFGGDDFANGSKTGLVFVVKAIQLRAIDIEHADQV